MPEATKFFVANSKSRKNKGKNEMTPASRKWKKSSFHWNERRVPDGRVGEGTEGAEGICNPKWGATVSTSQTPGAPRDWTSNQKVHKKGQILKSTNVSRKQLETI